MGEGPKDLRNDAERFDTPRADDLTGRSSDTITGRALSEVDPSATGVRAYDAGVSQTPAPGEDAANAGGTAETAAIRAEIEQKRADISGTIEEIQSRLSPRNVMASAGDATKERVRQFADTAGETASQVADRTREVAGQVADRTREVAGQVADRTRVAAGQVADRTRVAAGRAADTVRENPWPAVAVAAGVGAAAWWMMRRRDTSEYEELDVDDYSEESLYYDDFSATGGNRFIDAIRDHPVPTALTALGVGLLIWNRAGNRRDMYDAGDYRETWGTEGDYGADAGSYRSFGDSTWESDESATDRVRGAVSDATDRAKDAVSDAASRARGAMSGAAGKARGAMHDAAGVARERFSDVSSRTKRAARDTGAQIEHASRRAKTELEYWVEHNPLAVGGAALALGLVVGLALPETRQEQRLMGTARDRLVDRAQDFAGQAVDKAQQVASDVANKASEAMNKPQG